MNNTTKIVLRYTQSSILRPDARIHRFCLFIHFHTASSKQIGQFFNEYCPTSALEQYYKSVFWKMGLEHKLPSSEYVFTNVYITASGFEKMGYELFKMDKFRRNNNYFWLGMTDKTPLDFHMENMNSWQEEYTGNKDKLHALLTFSSNCESNLYQKVSELENRLSEIGKIVILEKGKKLTAQIDGETVTVEPFGYRDGIAKTNFFNDSGENLLGNQWQIALDQYYGSFLVFRKLQQDVRKFESEVFKLAKKIANNYPTKNDIEFAEAQIMGRFKNGIPLALSPSSIPNSNIENQIQEFNNFTVDLKNRVLSKGTYKDFDDEIGNKCPLHAHIRKTNPRIEEEIFRAKIPPIIVRRSIPFYYSKDNQGLLFMCFQRHIQRQFSSIQRQWCNDENYDQMASSKNKRLRKGLDPLVGRYKNQPSPENQKWLKSWNKTECLQNLPLIHNMVKTLGGEFFYAPPIPYFYQPLKNPIILKMLEDD